MNSPKSNPARFLAVLTALSSVTLLSAQQVPVPSPSSAPTSERRSESSATEPASRSDRHLARANDGSLSRSDRNFLEEAAKSGLKEVQVSQVVLAKLATPAARDFAQMMVTDHSAANAELKALAARKGVTLPEAKERFANKWADKTRNVDRDYIEEMKDDHQDAIKLFEKGSKSEDPEIAAFAQKTLPALRQHLSQLENQILPAIER